MYFNGAAARRFQSVEPKLKHAPWSEFSYLLLERFGRDQKESLIRQLFRMRQFGLVAEYVEKFSEPVDQLTAYGHVTEPVYCTMRFVEGLRDDIRSAVSLHRPVDFDTAASLALLQEEISGRPREYKRLDPSYLVRPSTKGPHPLPTPPTADKQALPVLHEEKKLCEGKSPEERWAALRAYIRAKDLCLRCAERWNRDHKCAASVQLHVVQELLELFNLEDSSDSVSVSDHQDQLFVALSAEAVSGTEGPRTMRLNGMIQGHTVLILVDSGRTHTFVSQQLASQLIGVETLT